MDNELETKETVESSDTLKKFYDVVAACNRCGFCTSYCPTYNATGDEGMSPRGRNQTFRALIEGTLANPVQASKIVDSCLLCGECTSICFSEVPTAQLMVHARSLINQTVGVPKYLNFFLTHILRRRSVFYWVLKLMFVGKAIGLSRVLRKMGLLKRISPELATADELVEKTPVRFFMDDKRVRPYLESTHEKMDQETLEVEHKLEKMRQRHETIPEELLRRAGFLNRPKVAFLPVCGSQYLNPRIGLSSVKLINRLKMDFIIPKLVCCGLPAASYGVLDQVREIAMQNIKQLEKGNYEALIVDDSSCTSHIRDYPKYFYDDRDWQNRAHAVSQKVRDISSFLLMKGLAGHLQRLTWNGGPVAYHDPCKAQHALKLTTPPRDLLLSINRLNLVSINEADQCCGGGGTYSFVHPEMSRDVLARKIKNIVASGCKILVTSAASCLVQLAYGLRESHPQIEVLHITEFLVRAIDKQR